MILELTVGEGKPQLGYATTRQLMEELAARMEITQNSTAGRDLARMCRAGLDGLDRGVLNYSTMHPRGVAEHES